jgi:hypothetical protein
MIITVDRFKSDSDATISKVNVDGAFVCFGLEDEYREQKVASETRIPAGRYKVNLRREGGFHTRYAGRFPSFHKGMLHVTGVPGFTFILIHIGNTDEDTAGCLLVGLNAAVDDGELRVTSSKLAYQKFYPMVVDAAERGELDIEYLDNDR